MSKNSKYQKAAERIRKASAVEDPSRRYGITIATLDSVTELLGELASGRVETARTIFEDEAEFFRQCGFEVVSPDDRWRAWHSESRSGLPRWFYDGSPTAYIIVA